MSFSDDENVEDFIRQTETEPDGRPNSLLHDLHDVSPSQGQDLGTPSVTSSDEEHDPPRERFKGSRQRWFQLNKPERDLSASIDAIEAENLSVHLYNAYAWKRRVRESHKINQSQVNPKLLKHQHKFAVKEWTPKSKWTAWPLRAEVVPRATERFTQYYEAIDIGDELFKYQPRIRQKPSGPLEDSLLSEVLKQARHGFHANQSRRKREAEMPEPATKRRKVDYTQEHKQSRDDTESAGQEEQEDASTASETSSEKLMEDPDSSQDVADEPPQENQESSNSYEPSIMSDEDAARKIALPAIRHTLSKLDKLLMNLHHSRRHMTHPHSYKPAMESRRSEAPDLKSRPIHSSFRSLGQRDWSEVLNAAALSGWDQEVLQRCAARCSALFGESMTFHTLHEQQELFGDTMAYHSSAQREATSEPNQDPEPIESEPDNQEVAPSDEETDDTTSQQEVENASSNPLWDPRYLVCLISTCKEYLKNYKTMTKLQKHLENAHGIYDNVRFEQSDHPEPYYEASNDNMVGGVHVDGFLQPILMRSKWGSVRPLRSIPGRGKRRRTKVAGPADPSVQIITEDESH